MADLNPEEGEIPISARTKHAILRELNSQLLLRAQQIRTQRTAEDNIGDLLEAHHDESDTHLKIFGKTYAVNEQIVKRISSQTGKVNKEDSFNTSLAEHRPSKIPLASKDVCGNTALFEIRSSKFPLVSKPYSGTASLRSAKAAKHSPSARQRRRDVVREYRPGYQWNLGGRVKELRIRCTARKFLFLWMKRTFGRVRPSVARMLYEWRLKRSCFTEWNELWWEERQEWRLTTRASIHHRMYNCNKAFRAWRLFTLSRREQKMKLKMADERAVRKLNKSTFDCWLMYLTLRRNKKQFYKEGEDFYKKYLLRCYWNQWILLLMEEKKQEQQKRNASNFWNKFLFIQTFSKWQLAFKDQCHQKSQWRLAEAHHNHQLERKIFHVFQKHVTMRQFKKDLKKKAERQCNFKVLEAYFHVWEVQWQKIKMLEERRQHVEKLVVQFKCHKILVHWKYFVVLQREARLRMNMAEDHYKRQLMKATVCNWKLFKIRCHVKAMRQQLANRFLSNSLLTRMWLTWNKRLEEREDHLLYPSYTVANNQFRLVTLQKAMKQWHRFLVIQLNQKKQMHRAIDHFTATIMIKALWSLKENAKFMKYKHELNDRAMQFQRVNVLWLSFHKWYSSFEESQDSRMMERMAVIHYDNMISEHFFSVWRSKTELRLEDAQLQDVAVQHNDYRLVKHAFMDWKTSVDAAKKNYSNELLATQFHYKKLAGQVWKGLKQYWQWKKRKAVETSQAQAHYHRVILRKTFMCLKKYHRAMKEVNSVVTVRIQEQNRTILRSVLSEWHANAKLERCLREKEKLAQVHFSKQLLRPIVVAWHEFALMRSYRRSETANTVHSAQQALAKGILSRSFRHWQSAYAASVQLNLGLVRAAHHSNSCILHKAWDAWTVYVKLCQRKNLLQMHCAWLHNMQLLSKHFRHWRLAFNKRENENKKAGMALWFWAQNLQLKTFLAWRDYVEERRRKAARLVDAMEMHRRRLLKQGTSQWLAVAADLSQMRMRFAAEQGAKNFYKIHQTVLKCASHWRHLVAKRRASSVSAVEKRSCLPLPSSSKFNPVLPKLSSTAPAWTLKSQSTVDFLSRVPVVGHTSRAQPRQPSFLLDSVAEGLLPTAKHNKISTLLSADDPINKTFLEPDHHFHGESLKSTVPVNAVVTSPSSISIPVMNPLKQVSSENSLHFASLAAPFYREIHSGDGQDSDCQPRPPLSSSIHTTASHSTKQIFHGTLLSDNMEFLPTTDSESSFLLDRDVEATGYHRAVKCNTKVPLSKQESDADVRSHHVLPLSSLSSTLVLLPPTAFLPQTATSRPSNKTSHMQQVMEISENQKQELGFNQDRITDREDTTKGRPLQDDATSVQSVSALPAAPGHRDGITDELLSIKKRLSTFQENKEKLRKAKENKTYLEGFRSDLRKLSGKFRDGSSDDPDIVEIESEIKELEKDIKLLSTVVNRDRLEAVDLAKRAREILVASGLS